MAADVSRPNILMIMSDQHTPSVMGCYGNEVVRTPNMDRLAAAGVTFENAYCSAPVCVPSRMSMLTGLHCDKIRVWHNADPLMPHLTTWPMALRLAGYETVISGRMHLLWGDRMGGFEKRLCGDATDRVPNITPDRTMCGTGRPQGIDTHIGEGDAYPQDEEAKVHAIRYLRQEHAQPFALCVGFYKPHAPFVAERRFLELYSDFEPELTLDEPCVALYRSCVDGCLAKGPLDPERVRLAVRCYYGMVSHVDALVGEVLHALEEEGLTENTVVIYTSDHGEMLGRHKLWHKMCFYEDSVRVPLIISCPARFPGNVRRTENVSLLDLFPTFLDLVGCERKIPLDGGSLVPSLEGKPLGRPNEVMSLSIGVQRGHPAIMLKRDALKLICTKGFASVLFDLSEDPQENVDFSNDPAYASVLREMLASVAKRWDADRVNEQVEFNQSHLDQWRLLQEKQAQDGRIDPGRWVQIGVG